MRLKRGEVLDSYVEGDEGVFLLADHRVLALGPLPTAVMCALEAGPLDLAAVTNRLLDAFGNPPPETDAATMVHAIVSEMSDLGLVAQLHP